jgi:AhpD family alkylhydroperoxidase
MKMEPRLEFAKVSPETYQAMLTVSKYTSECGLEHSLLELVKTRASQINGCAYCIQMHTRDARKLGETEERLHLLPAWRETEIYTPRERAALVWTEALTLLTDGHAPDDVYAEVKAQFSEAEIAKLTLAIGVINSWNRIAVGLRFVPRP